MRTEPTSRSARWNSASFQKLPRRSSSCEGVLRVSQEEVGSAAHRRGEAHVQKQLPPNLEAQQRVGQQAVAQEGGEAGERGAGGVLLQTQPGGQRARPQAAGGGGSREVGRELGIGNSCQLLRLGKGQERRVLIIATAAVAATTTATAAAAASRGSSASADGGGREWRISTGALCAPRRSGAARQTR